MSHKQASTVEVLAQPSYARLCHWSEEERGSKLFAEMSVLLAGLEQAIRPSTDREVPGIAPGLDKLADSGSGQPIDADKGLTAESFVQPATESVTAGATGVSVPASWQRGAWQSLLMQGYLWSMYQLYEAYIWEEAIYWQVK